MERWIWRIKKANSQSFEVGLPERLKILSQEAVVAVLLLMVVLPLLLR
jgi:hypothetical protein